jgi:hypothetical protein
MEKAENKEVICCTLNPSQMQERKNILQKLHCLVKEKMEVENGYLFRFDGSNDIINQIVDIIKLERQCCSFLNFNITIEKETAPVFLKITGPQGTKDFLLYELGF